MGVGEKRGQGGNKGAAGDRPGRTFRQRGPHDIGTGALKSTTAW